MDDIKQQRNEYVMQCLYRNTNCFVNNFFIEIRKKKFFHRFNCFGEWIEIRWQKSDMKITAIHSHSLPFTAKWLHKPFEWQQSRSNC